MPILHDGMHFHNAFCSIHTLLSIKKQAAIKMVDLNTLGRFSASIPFISYGKNREKSRKRQKQTLFFAFFRYLV